MKPKVLKTLLLREINSLNRSKYAKSPGADFTRSRKLPFNTLITTMLRMEGRSMGNELISIFFPKASETPSVSAFVQQRNKLKAGVFDDLFHSLDISMEFIQPPKTINGLRLLAVDGSDVQNYNTMNEHKAFSEMVDRDPGWIMCWSWQTGDMSPLTIWLMLLRETGIS